MPGTRAVREVAVDDPAEFFGELRAALAGDGPALLPRPAGWSQPTPELQDARVPSAVALVIETSGSTATPKRVMLTASGLLAAARATHERLAGDGAGDAQAGGEQWLLTLPGHYIAGAQVLVRSIAAGTTPVFADAARFTPESFLAAAARLTGRRRYVSLVPVQLRRLADAARADERVAAALAGFDGILVGGQATPRDLLAEARALGWPVVTTYGSSETSGGAAYNARPLPGVRMREVDGELHVASPSLALGYLGDAQRTARTFVTDAAGERWYRTGDAGTVAPDGTIAVTGRFDSVIISGGIKVNLDEVALAANSTGAFSEVVAVAVPSREWGERVALVAADPRASDLGATGLVADTGEDARWQRIRSALDALGPAARPALFLRIRELPRLASGKPDRRALRELAETFADAPQ